MILIRGAQVVSSQSVEKADIFIVKERIASVEPQLTQPPGAKIVEAHGLLALPGLIDIHVHLREPGGEHKEDIASGTRAALAGGVTTVLGMPNTTPPITDEASLEAVLDLAGRKAMCDFGFYIGATHDNINTASRVRRAVGLKMYMGSSTGTLLVDRFEDQYAHMEAYPRDRIIAVHAENEEAVRFFAGRQRRRPPLCAELETSRAIMMARSLKRSVHICHVSTAREMQMIGEAKRHGERVTCEVTPHHLFLSSVVEKYLGTLGQMNPPLRSKADVDTLWDSLELIDVIASDHAPHTLEEKNSDAPPAGVPGVETMLPLLLTAVEQKLLSLTELARLTAEGPARLFGLEGKGRIAPDYDADLVLVDPQVQWTITGKNLLTRCGWTPFEGWRVRGQIKQVYLRGQLVFADGQVLAQPGTGRPVKQR